MSSRNPSIEMDELRSEIDLLKEENGRLRDENRRLRARSEALQTRAAAAPARGEGLGYAHSWMTGQRLGIFVDVPNLYYTAKYVYDSKLHYRKLLEHIVRGRQIIRAIAYVVEKEGADQTAFYDALRYAGYEIRAKALIERSDGTRRGDWELGIAIDCLSMAARLDTAILVTGEGEYAPLVDALKARGVRVEVCSFPESIGDRLKHAAHEFIALDSSHLVD